MRVRALLVPLRRVADGRTDGKLSSGNAGDLNFGTVVTDTATLEKDLDSGDAVLAFPENEAQLQEFAGLMRGGSLFVCPGEACEVTDSLAQDCPVLTSLDR